MPSAEYEAACEVREALHGVTSVLAELRDAVWCLVELRRVELKYAYGIDLEAEVPGWVPLASLTERKR